MKRIAFAVALLVVGAILFYKLRQETVVSQPETVTAPHAVKQIQLPVRAPPAATDSASNNPCDEEGRLWLNFDLSEFTTPGKTDGLTIEMLEGKDFLAAVVPIAAAGKCTGFSDPVLNGSLLGLRKSCRATKIEVESEEGSKSASECLRAVLDFRMAYLDRMTANVPLEHISDENTLVNKMISTVFSSTLAQDKQMEHVIRVASRLLQVNPNHREAALYLAKARLRLYEDGSANEKQARLKEFEKAVDKISDFSTDFDGLALKFRLARLEENSHEMVRVAQGLIANEVNYLRAEGYYFLAWERFERGDSQEAIRMLQNGLKDDPGNGLIANTLNRLTGKTKPDDSPLFSDTSEGFVGISIVGPPYRERK